MNTFDDTRSTLAGKLTAAGVAGVTLDPAALPPFVLVDLPDVDRAAGVGAWGCSLEVKIVVPPPGDAVAGTALLDTLEVVLRTLGFAPARRARVMVGDKECPAYTLTYPVDVPNPDC